MEYDRTMNFADRTMNFADENYENSRMNVWEHLFLNIGISFSRAVRFTSFFYLVIIPLRLANSVSLSLKTSYSSFLLFFFFTSTMIVELSRTFEIHFFPNLFCDVKRESTAKDIAFWLILDIYSHFIFPSICFTRFERIEKSVSVQVYHNYTLLEITFVPVEVCGKGVCLGECFQVPIKGMGSPFT